MRVRYQDDPLPHNPRCSKMWNSNSKDADHEASLEDLFLVIMERLGYDGRVVAFW